MAHRSEWERVTDRSDTCEAGVTRNGEYVPCEKPAVALRIWADEWPSERMSPVCVHHCKVGEMVPLATILRRGEA